MQQRWWPAVLTLALVASGCSQQQSASTASVATAAPQAAAPHAAQANPAGDIPDTQLFVPYASSGGYSVLAPEGWSRSTQGSDVTFTWHYDGERAVETRGASSTGAALAAIRSAFAGVRDAKAKTVTLPSGPATLITYTSDSATDAVTGKRIRLENNSYVFARGGKSVRVDLWAPLGADNVDQWRKISRSFAWK
ncbi:MAG TPA: hypothetical protein VIG32_05250 [Candidatus Baltobacteraceae bacterium]|jgi:hypothetical protein